VGDIGMSRLTGTSRQPSSTWPSAGWRAPAPPRRPGGWRAPWAEDHAHAVFAGRRQIHALLGHLGAVQRIGHLDQDAGAVAHQRIGPHRAAVVEVLQDLERVADDGVALLAPDVGHEADPAGVVLVRRVVQALGLQMFLFSRRGHRGLHQSQHKGARAYCSATKSQSILIRVRSQLILISIC
jgi:hypothetical protein